MTTTEAPTTGLEPVRAALLRRSRDAAAVLVKAAEDEGRIAVADAERQAAAVVEAARQLGLTEGADLLAADLAAARRRARARVLAEQRGLFEEVRRQARHTVLEVVNRPGNRARLTERLRATLGDTAVVEDTADGGLSAHTPDGRSVDASIGALADSALDQLDMGALWTAS